MAALGNIGTGYFSPFDQTRITEADCTGYCPPPGTLPCPVPGGTWTPGFGDATVQDLIATGSTSLAGHVVLGSASTDYIDIKGRIRTRYLHFDPSGVPGNPVVTLEVGVPTADTTIYLPAITGTVLLTTSTTSALQGVGALDTGSIVAGFGAINTDNVITTVCSAGGVCPTLTSGGSTVMEKATGFSEDGTPATASLTIDWETTLQAFTQDGVDTTITFTMPSKSDGVLDGQMLVIHNDDQGTVANGGDGNNMVHVSNAVRPIWPGVAATYYYIGNRWVQTSYICSKQANNGYCEDSTVSTTDRTNGLARIAAGHTNPE